jgi:hypothetical protein
MRSVAMQVRADVAAHAPPCRSQHRLDHRDGAAFAYRPGDAPSRARHAGRPLAQQRRDRSTSERGAKAPVRSKSAAA